MTEDYKNKLLKYLTGNLDSESGTNEPQLIDKGTINQNINDYLTTNLNNTAGIQGVITQEGYDCFLIYGYYQVTEGSYEGYIYLVSKDLQPISLITEYESGTKFRPFMTLNIDENGYIYGVDNKNALYDDTVPNSYRFIMLNKVIVSTIAEETPSVKLRQSYFFNSTINNQITNFGLDGKDKCYKKVGSADYFFFASVSSGLGVVAFKINVGETNTWTITTNSSVYPYNFVRIMPEYNNDNLTIVIGAKSNSNYDYVEILYTDGDTPTITPKASFDAVGSIISDVVKIGVEDTYIAYTTYANSQYTTILGKANYITNNIDIFYTFEPLTADFWGVDFNFEKTNNQIFFKYLWDDESDETIIKSYIGFISDIGVYYINGIDTEIESTSIIGRLFINNIYNLYSIYSPQANTNTQKIQLVFNQNNYNGLPYEAPNCLIPNSAILYDTNDDIVFARNLYNKTISGQTTTSIVQIPNTLLNDTTIAKNDLLGQTNVILVDDDTEITKNIYETVNINFANTISIRNDNDPNNKILNPAAAVRLNSSTSNLGDYSDAKGSHIKVNYTDNTSSIINLDSSQVTFTSDTEATYSFDLYVNKAINNIQIVSNDNATVYQTMTNLNLVVGKTYSITQDVEVM